MKIVVPVMPRSLEEAQMLDVAKYDLADIIEWRADYLPKEEILTVAPAIFEKFVGREVLFTLRTNREGGNIALEDSEYVSLIKEVNAIYQPDYIDYEYFSHMDVFHEMLEFSNLVLSYHNFEETPGNIMEAFSEMTALSPRVVKIAVMPKTNQDVLDLMNFTRGFKTLNPEQEYAVMAMGKLGRITRVAGELMGSCWSYASLDEESAPGQIPLHQLTKFLEVLDAD
ncbi:type I 3-dehydroquinate dehydratase [Streptococcus hillyeri]|uniref:3-dehydroquinate dehydratase n=1 Tax=Streptococcus hillyeri TaxID=2282420 RepID=A0A3L9DXI0_9STRE|nr:type I 3-dehydroquinate dehydratase [Streptococcus hillyeri]RLY04429.1 type I 3-dehydroquinate dehydratase [Streptococcus hillyeri]